VAGLGCVRRFLRLGKRQTLDRRDVRFWQDMARRAGGKVLELGCGTGRVTLPSRARARASSG